MAFIVGALGGAVVYRVAHSDHSDHSNYGDYSDAAERRRIQKNAKERELQSSKQRLQSLINVEIERIKSQYEVTGDIQDWNTDTAIYQDFNQDYSGYEQDITNQVKFEIKQKLKDDIAADEDKIREMNQVITKINRIQLLKKR